MRFEINFYFYFPNRLGTGLLCSPPALTARQAKWQTILLKQASNLKDFLVLGRIWRTPISRPAHLAVGSETGAAVDQASAGATHAIAAILGVDPAAWGGRGVVQAQTLHQLVRANAELREAREAAFHERRTLRCLRRSRHSSIRSRSLHKRRWHWSWSASSFGRWCRRDSVFNSSKRCYWFGKQAEYTEDWTLKMHEIRIGH